MNPKNRNTAEENRTDLFGPEWSREAFPGVPLPDDHLERVYGWGMSVSSAGYVFRPSTLEGVRDVFALARRTGRTVGFRGAGRSYGDASINSENIVLDLTRMNRILDWDPSTGVIRVEPGVTIKQLWEYILQDGWWPAVVPGTMFPTIGGCASNSNC